MLRDAERKKRNETVRVRVCLFVCCCCIFILVASYDSQCSNWWLLSARAIREWRPYKVYLFSFAFVIVIALMSTKYFMSC